MDSNARCYIDLRLSLPIALTAHHCLAALAARLSTKCRCSKRKKITVGTVATTEAAITTPQSVVYCPRKFATPTATTFSQSGSSRTPYCRHAVPGIIKRVMD